MGIDRTIRLVALVSILGQWPATAASPETAATAVPETPGFTPELPLLDTPPPVSPPDAGAASAFGAPEPLFDDGRVAPPTPELQKPPGSSFSEVPLLLSPYAPLPTRDEDREWRDLGRGFSWTATLTAGATYDDNVYLRNGSGSSGTFSFFASPSISITRGGSNAYEEGAANRLSLDYSTTFRFYDGKLNDELDHNFGLSGTYNFGRLVANFRQAILIYSDAAVNGRDEREQRRFYSSSLGLSYPITTRLALTQGFNYGTRDFDGGFAAHEYVSQTGFAFDWRPKIKVGLSIGLGYLETENQPNQTFQTYSLNASYEASELFNFQASVGLEERQLDEGSKNGLVFAGTANYRPRERTAISLSLYRRNDIASNDVSPVAGRFEDEYTATGVSLNVQERIMDKFLVSVSAGYENASYFSSRTGVDSDREFNFLYVRVGVQVPIGKRFKVGAGYVFRSNTTESSTGDDSSDFTNNQVSVSASVSF